MHECVFHLQAKNGFQYLCQFGQFSKIQSQLVSHACEILHGLILSSISLRERSYEHETLQQEGLIIIALSKYAKTLTYALWPHTTHAHTRTHHLRTHHLMTHTHTHTRSITGRTP